MKHAGFAAIAASCLLVWLLALHGPLMAQDIDGAIVGTAKDATGGLITDATVVAINVGTRAKTPAATLPDGSFIIRVPPGNYYVSVQAPGFETVRVQNIHIYVNTQSRADAVLKVGASSEVVSVSAVDNDVDTTSATIKESIGATTILDLPLNGRNPLSLIVLIAGVTRDPKANVTSGATYPGASGISINGGRSDTTNYILDGSSANDNYTNAPNPLPNPDALQEFSVQTNNFDAEFGRLPGGIVNAVTRSGVNAFHGTGYEYIRNNYFNALDFFAGPIVNGKKPDDGLKRHQFGGSVGGPILIPHVYNGRDKSFFFFSLQETLVHQRPLGTSANVPDALELAGNFSETGNLYMPYAPNQATFNQSTIPMADWSPVAKKLLPFLPLASAAAPASKGQQTVQYQSLNNTADRQDLIRIDQHIRSNNTLYGTFFNSRQTAQSFLNPANYLALKNQGAWLSRRYQANDTHLFRATLVNEASFSYAHNQYANTPIYPSATLPQLGVGSGNGFWASQAEANPGLWVPQGQAEYQFNVSTYFNMATGDTNEFIRDEYQGIETVRWSHGNHQFSFGGEYYYGTGDNINDFQQNPAFTFTGSKPSGANPANSTGNSFADFLIGDYSSFTQGAGEFKNTRYNQYAAFAEDNWKALPRLMLNLGVRYEPFLPDFDLNNKLAVWRPGQQSTLYPNAAPGVLFVGDPNIPKGGFKASYKNVGPRIGFAYDVFGDGSTSIRGGYGIFFDQPNTITTNPQTDQAPFAPVVTLNGTALNSVANPYGGSTNTFSAYPSQSGGYTIPPTPTAGFTFPAYSTQYLYAANMRNAYTESWNLQVERNIGFKTVVDVAYAASAATHLPNARELNPAAYCPNDPSCNAQLDSNPLYTTGATASNYNQRRLIQQPTCAPNSSPCRLVNGLGSTTLLAPAGSSNYNSIKVALRRHFIRGFSFLANYTFSKSLDADSNSKETGQFRTIPWDPRFDYGPSDFDRRHVLNASTVWQIHAPSHNGLEHALLNGWENTLIFNYTGGYPFSVFSGAPNALTGTANQRANSVPGVAVYTNGFLNNQATKRGTYIKAAAFVANPVGTFGDTGRNAYRGPGYTDFDGGVSKNLATLENFKLMFRFEAFNFLNHTNLTGPPTNTLTSGTFGEIASDYGPRVLQFALRASF